MNLPGYKNKKNSCDSGENMCYILKQMYFLWITAIFFVFECFYTEIRKMCMKELCCAYCIVAIFR